MSTREAKEPPLTPINSSQILIWNDDSCECAEEEFDLHSRQSAQLGPAALRIVEALALAAGLAALGRVLLLSVGIIGTVGPGM